MVLLVPYSSCWVTLFVGPQNGPTEDRDGNMLQLACSGLRTLSDSLATGPVPILAFCDRIIPHKV